MAGENKKASGDAVEPETSKKSMPKTKNSKTLKPVPKITKKVPKKSNAKEELEPKPKVTKKVPKKSNAKEELEPKPKVTKKLPTKSNAEEESKPEPKITKELPDQSKSKEETEKPPSTQVSGFGNKDKNKEKEVENKKPPSTQVSGFANKDTNKEKDTSSRKKSDNAQVKDQRDERNLKKIDGMIFMCNAKTKLDCFQYMVMGLPIGKRDLVATIKPGLNLFLYDFGAKLLYGIYKATSAGGMKLEPAAFNGLYPAQVRFKVHSECLPLPEATFRKAIASNSGGNKLKFDTELTAEQVQNLIRLFEPLPEVTSIANPSITPQPIIVPLVPLRPEVLPRGPIALNEYRGRSESAHAKEEDVHPLAFGEKEYRMFGLKRPTTISEPAPALAPIPAVGAYNPYYLPPARTGYPSEMDYQADFSRRRIGESEYRRPEQLAAQLPPYRSYPYSRGEIDVEYGRREAEVSRLHSSHAATALSDYNRIHQELGAKEDYGSVPVSSRYSFAGPSFSHR